MTGPVNPLSAICNLNLCQRSGLALPSTWTKYSVNLSNQQAAEMQNRTASLPLRIFRFGVVSVRRDTSELNAGRLPRLPLAFSSTPFGNNRAWPTRLVKLVRANSIRQRRSSGLGCWGAIGFYPTIARRRPPVPALLPAVPPTASHKWPFPLPSDTGAECAYGSHEGGRSPFPTTRC